jgi:hypothetical protein
MIVTTCASAKMAEERSSAARVKRLWVRPVSCGWRGGGEEEAGR